MKNLFKVVILSLVIFTLSATLVSAFSDISDADADFLVSKGVLTGYEDGTFRPNAPITRAEFSTVMCRALNLVDYARSLVTEQRFTDVPTSHWACGYVNALASKGIISGVGDGNFDPDNTVTYAQVSKIIAGALGYTQEDADHYGGFPRGWQKIAERVGFAVETEDINGPISRIGVVRALSRSDIVYKEPKIVATIDDIKNGDASFLATVEKHRFC